MTTPFQHFITLAQRVIENIRIDESEYNPTDGISWISAKQNSSSIVFGRYPFTCQVHFTLLSSGDSNVSCAFSCPIDSDESEFDTLFKTWTENVDGFLASNSPLLIDNQIKSILKK